MELLPMRLHFDSPQSFSLWLAAALPSCRHEVRGGAVRVASSDLSAVLIKPGAPGYVAIEYEKPSGSVASLVALVQFAALVGGLWLLMKDGHYPGLIVRENGIDSFSKTGAVWWACALAFVVFMAWLPGAVVHFLGRSGASPIRGALAALLQGHPPPAPVGKGTGAGLALAVALVAVVSVGLTVGALFSSTGSPSATQDNPTVSSPRPAEETWRTESGPGWTLSVPSGWARREVNGSVTLESTDPLNPTVTRLLSAAVPHFATMADVRLLLARRFARMGRTVTEREVSANGMTWFEVEWLNVDTTPVRGFRRGGLAGGRVWEIDCAGDDVLFERVRPTCERFLASLRITAPPPAPPSPATTTAGGAAPPTTNAAPRDVSGRWSTLFGGGATGPSRARLALVQSGAAVTGRYRGRGGSGTVSGTLRGSTVRGTWRDQAGTRGSFTWNFAPDGSRFAGDWSYEGSARTASWSGSREP